MKLVIASDDGDCEVVIDGIETFCFADSIERYAIINAIQRTVNKVKAFQAANSEPVVVKRARIDPCPINKHPLVDDNRW